MRTKNINIQKGTDTKVFKCSLCCKIFSSNGSLSTHIKSIHEGEKHNCDQCGKDFTSKGNLYQHVQTVHEKKKFPCLTCKADFTSKGNLYKHVQTIHEKKKFPCLSCNAELSSKSILISHIKKKHEKYKILDNLAQLDSNAKISLEDQEKSQSIKVRSDCRSFDSIIVVFINYVTLSLNHSICLKF